MCSGDQVEAQRLADLVVAHGAHVVDGIHDADSVMSQSVMEAGERADPADTWDDAAETDGTSSADVTRALIVALIDRRHSDPRLDVEGIARELHFSRRQLYRLAEGEGIAAMLAERRVAAACEMLERRPDLSTAEIAAATGFSNAARMRMQMLRRRGITPSELRLAARAARIALPRPQATDTPNSSPSAYVTAAAPNPIAS